MWKWLFFKRFSQQDDKRIIIIQSHKLIKETINNGEIKLFFFIHLYIRLLQVIFKVDCFNFVTLYVRTVVILSFRSKFVVVKGSEGVGVYRWDVVIRGRSVCVMHANLYVCMFFILYIHIECHGPLYHVILISLAKQMTDSTAQMGKRLVLLCIHDFNIHFHVLNHV